MFISIVTCLKHHPFSWFQLLRDEGCVFGCGNNSAGVYRRHSLQFPDQGKDGTRALKTRLCSALSNETVVSPYNGHLSLLKHLFPAGKTDPDCSRHRTPESPCNPTNSTFYPNKVTNRTLILYSPICTRFI